MGQVKHWAAGVSTAAMIVASPVLAADAPVRKSEPTLPIMAQLPAVDGINAKVGGFGGWIDRPRQDLVNGIPVFNLGNQNRSQSLFGGVGSLSIPLGQRFGLQVDGLASSARGGFVGGGAGHLFWRDPSVGLFGLYGSATRNNQFNGVNRYKGGVEAELYLGRFTISGIAGWEQSQSGGGFVGTIPGFNIFDLGGRTNRFFNAVDLAYYPVDNWKVSVGHRFSGGRHMAAAGTEYMFQLGGGTAASIFAEGRYGERGNRAVFGGLNLYFGQKDKSLIRRHREDDPPNRLLDEMFSGTNGSATGGGGNSGRRRLAQPTNVAPPPPPPPPPCTPYCYGT